MIVVRNDAVLIDNKNFNGYAIIKEKDVNHKWSGTCMVFSYSRHSVYFYSKSEIVINDLERTGELFLEEKRKDKPALKVENLRSLLEFIQSIEIVSSDEENEYLYKKK